MPDDYSEIRGDKTTVVELDKRWRVETGKRQDFPKRFEMSKREWGEYKKNLGGAQLEKAAQGLPVFRGARVEIKG